MVGKVEKEAGGGALSQVVRLYSPPPPPRLQVQASPSLSCSAYFSLISTTCNVTKQANQINQCRESNVSFNFPFIYLSIYSSIIIILLCFSMVLADMFLSVLEYNLKEIAYAADVAQLAYV